MTKIVVEMKGFTEPITGIFEGIINYTIGYPSFKDLENETNPIIDTTERIRLIRYDDIITDCPLPHVLRYWHRGRWVYIAHEPKRKRPSK